MLAQQGFPVIYNKPIALAAAITPRKLVRFTSNSSQLSWSKATQKLDILGRFWGIFGKTRCRFVKKGRRLEMAAWGLTRLYVLRKMNYGPL